MFIVGLTHKDHEGNELLGTVKVSFSKETKLLLEKAVAVEGRLKSLRSYGKKNDKLMVGNVVSLIEKMLLVDDFIIRNDIWEEFDCVIKAYIDSSTSEQEKQTLSDIRKNLCAAWQKRIAKMFKERNLK